MKFAKAVEHRDFFSGKASEFTRQLAFAGIAIVWVFKSGDGLRATLPGQFIPALLVFAFALLVDYLQYVVSAVVWRWFLESQKKRHGSDPDGAIDDSPAWISWINDALWHVKVVSLIGAYVWLVACLFGLA